MKRMRTWQQGANAKERVALRNAEDRERYRLSELDRTDPRPDGPSRLLEWTRLHYPPKPHPDPEPAPAATGRPPRRRIV